MILLSSTAGLVLAVVTGAVVLGVGLVFLAAAFGHWRHRAVMAGVVGNYRLLPAWAVAPVAMLLPLVELALGIALLLAPVLRVLALGAGLAAAGLLLVFALAMAVNLRRGRGFIDCGCGDPDTRQPLSWWLVGRNVLLALPLLFAGLLWQPLGGLDLLSVMTGGLAVALGYTLFNALVALLRGPDAHILKPVRR